MNRLISCLVVPTCLAIFAASAVAAQPAVVVRGDLNSRADDTGIVLYYDDGTAEGKRSIAGSGHAVLFTKPRGDWTLDRVEVFAARYGLPQPPEEDITIFLCDGTFKPIHTYKRPYSLFERGDLEWVSIELDPVPVPDRFYLCLAFNPSSTKGVYVAYDDSVSRSHSRMAFPGSHLRDVPDTFDWMIRAHLSPTSAEAQAAVTAAGPAEPAPAPAEPVRVTVSKPGVAVTTEGLDAAYAEAFAAILVEARREYRDVLGLSLPETISLQARRDPAGQLRLWTDGDSQLFLTVTSEDQLAPPARSGVFNVYGMCHELGHIVMYRGMRDLVGLPEGVGEGWAHYAGSVVVEAVAGRLGDTIWPQPYDVVATDGIARLTRQTADKDWDELDPAARAAKVFYRAEQLHGRETVGSCLAQALSERPTGRELMPRFVEALRRTAGDPAAGDWIPESVLTSAVKWQVQERRPAADFFSDLNARADDTGMLLFYDDGTSDGKRSTAGSGHAVLFQAPEGSWLLDAVHVFGARYGTPQPPDEDFVVYLCDEDFQPLQEFARPYALFDRGDLHWVTVDLGPTPVPRTFYLCISFNPTATKGVYMAYDDSVARSHSRAALPYSHVSDVKGTFDWMIRAHLRRAPAQQE